MKLTFLQLMILIHSLIISLFVFAWFFFNKIYKDFKMKTAPISADDIFFILRTTITSQIELYERNVFSHRPAMTNANFENYYRDIVEAIISSLSDSFFYKATSIMSRESIVQYICSAVRSHLTEKIAEYEIKLRG